MPNWLRKTIVVLITVFTLGTVTPPPHLLADSDERSKTESTAEIDQASHPVSESLSDGDDEEEYARPWNEVAATYDTHEQLQNAFIAYTIQQAEEQTKMKFGERIEARRGDEFRTVILPKIEETVEGLSTSFDEETLRNLTITERPTRGKSEKIFHIQNGTTNEDVFRLHVRREHPPGQGYWFSFHYHDANDNFESHHELGSIYWDKNTPPNWMS